MFLIFLIFYFVFSLNHLLTSNKTPYPVLDTGLNSSCIVLAVKLFYLFPCWSQCNYDCRLFFFSPETISSGTFQSLAYSEKDISDSSCFHNRGQLSWNFFLELFCPQMLTSHLKLEI